MDPAKARANPGKHRVPFEEAATVYGVPGADVSGPGSLNFEQRLHHDRISSAKRVLIVAHAERRESIRYQRSESYA